MGALTPRIGIPVIDPDFEAVAEVERVAPGQPTSGKPNRMTITVPTEDTVLSLGAGIKSSIDAGIVGKTAGHIAFTAGKPETTVRLGIPGTGDAHPEGYSVLTVEAATQESKQNHTVMSSEGNVFVTASKGYVSTFAKTSLYMKAETDRVDIHAATTIHEKTKVIHLHADDRLYSEAANDHTFSSKNVIIKTTNSVFIEAPTSLTISAGGCTLTMSNGQVMLTNGAGALIALTGAQILLYAADSVTAYGTNSVVQRGAKVACAAVGEMTLSAGESITGKATKIDWNP